MTQLITLVISVLVGIIILKVISFVWYFTRAYILTKYGFCKDLRKYGEWAVVTGASDGIGKEYAKQLATYGLNIVLISRSEDKLQRIAEEIKKESKVEVRVIVFDFSNVNDYGMLSSELKGLDIGVLINNVGQLSGWTESFHECDIETVVRSMNVNMISDVRMSHMVLPGMFKRKRGAIVHVSSVSAYMVIPKMNVYPSTKVFLKKFSETLKLESKGIVDHQVVTPVLVESNMSKMKQAPTIPSAKDYVASAIKTIGVVDVTCGYPSHEFVALVVNCVPLWIFDMLYESSEAANLSEKKD